MAEQDAQEAIGDFENDSLFALRLEKADLREYCETKIKHFLDLVQRMISMRSTLGGSAANGRARLFGVPGGNRGRVGRAAGGRRGRRGGGAAEHFLVPNRAGGAELPGRDGWADQRTSRTRGWRA